MSQLIPCSYCNGPGDCFVCGGSGWVEPPIKDQKKPEKMSRLDHIRKNLANVEDNYVIGGFVVDDARFLLSRLEIAEKALEWYAKIPHYDRRLSGGTSAVEADAGGRSREALKQIRE